MCLFSEANLVAPDGHAHDVKAPNLAFVPSNNSIRRLKGVRGTVPVLGEPHAEWRNESWFQGLLRPRGCGTHVTAAANHEERQAMRLRGASLVAVVQAADRRNGDHASSRRRRHWTRDGGVFVQAQVCS
jgi:hypothetical protein